MRLIPFIEKAPFYAAIPFLRRHGLGCVYNSGRKHIVFEVDGVRFSTVICFEGLFPSLVRTFVLRGADFIVNMTNDEPSLGRMPFYYKINKEMLALRAVENRRSIVRVANNGISAVIDPWGRTVAEAPAMSSAAINVAIPISRQSSFYSRHGNFIIWVCVFLLGLNLGSFLCHLRTKC